MDEALALPEILNLICEAVDFDRLPTLARVSKAFCAPALDHIWRFPRVPGLFKSLPDDVWEELDTSQPYSKALRFTRPIVPRDLQRFRELYALRVWSYSDALSLISPASLTQLLQAVPESEKLFPNLKILELRHGPDPEEIWTRIKLFACASVETISIDIDTELEPPHNQDSVLADAFAHLGTLAPSLRSFSLRDTRPGFGMYADGMLLAPCPFQSWPLLRIVDILAVGLGQEQLDSIAALPHLEDLTCRIPMSLEVEFPSEDAFRSLTGFNVRTSAANCLAVLMAVPVGKLSSISLTVLGGPELSSYVELFLRKPATSHVPLHLDHFKPVLALRNLSWWTFHSRCHFDLSDDDVRDIGIAFPNLEVLYLGRPRAVWPWPNPPRVTLEGFGTCVTSMPKLREASIPFYVAATEIPSVKVPLDGRYTLTLRTLHLSSSRLDENATWPAALFLSNVCPRLTRMAADGLEKDEKDRWELVRGAHSRLAKVRHPQLLVD
ncbi:hypothetical protein DL96DRAFT_1712098 [Flagelloscypha sp. PMI_526]|nr:hypothetical protein DL96DRAFT_1712098 [Flagelloscypha sp. PMI_526]